MPTPPMTISSSHPKMDATAITNIRNDGRSLHSCRAQAACRRALPHLLFRNRG